MDFSPLQKPAVHYQSQFMFSYLSTDRNTTGTGFRWSTDNAKLGYLVEGTREAKFDTTISLPGSDCLMMFGGVNYG